MPPVYWLNVADPGFDFGGVIEHTHLVPAEVYGGRHLVYLSCYLARQVAQLIQIFGRDVRRMLDRGRVFRCAHAAPQPVIDFHHTIPPMCSPVSGLFLTNMCHAYPDERSVGNSLRVAAEAARALGRPPKVCFVRHFVGPNSLPE